MRQSLVLLLFAAATAGAAAQDQPTQSSQQSTSPKANESITVTGCLAAGANDTFTLTASPAAGNSAEPVTGSTATTPAGSKVTKTITYTLTGSNADLKSHVGHTIQVTGVESAPRSTSQAIDTRGGEATAQGTTGTSGTYAGSGAKPNVQTTAQTQNVARQLTVNSVKMVSNSCELTK